MKLFSSFIVLFVLLSVVGIIEGHTRLASVTINGVTETRCLRPTYDDARYYAQTGIGSLTPQSDDATFPNGIEGENYTCGWQPFASGAATSKCTVAAGSTIAVTHYNHIENQYIAPNHRGPFFAYMARHEQSGGVPSGSAWFKIYQAGLVELNANVNYNKWTSPDTLNAQQGKIYFKIPSDIAPGNYLLRTEILAFLITNPRGAQAYVRCVELTVTGSGTVVPGNRISIPGGVTYNDPGVKGVWWSDYATSYPFPGPPVYVEGSTPPPPTPTPPTPPPPTPTPPPTPPPATPVTTQAAPITTRAATTQSMPATTGRFQDCSAGRVCPKNSECVDGNCYCLPGFMVEGRQCVAQTTMNSSNSLVSSLSSLLLFVGLFMSYFFS